MAKMYINHIVTEAKDTCTDYHACQQCIPILHIKKKYEYTRFRDITPYKIAITSTGYKQRYLVVTVPLTNVAKPLFFREKASSVSQIGYILKERRCSPITAFTRSENKLNHGCVVVEPQSKKIATFKINLRLQLGFVVQLQG